MLILFLALGCAGGSDACQAGPPSFFVEPLTESGAFITEIEVDWGRAAAEETNRVACTLGDEYWECGQGQPDAYTVYLGGPGWNRRVERIDVAQPEDPCLPERDVLSVTMLPE